MCGAPSFRVELVQVSESKKPVPRVPEPAWGCRGVRARRLRAQLEADQRALGFPVLSVSLAVRAALSQPDVTPRPFPALAPAT